ncbi:MAG: ADP-ribosylglycohydrolase [Anaerolineales bacterium]|nr:ADP-ribosylglycohydrolase family protein [Anaerolineae bacterium]PWB55481.1 MAG: ADP-ribosylglycohydrolase [Anaerolineales bacterium]
MSPVLPRALARSRHRGCLLGLAAGDALGTALEFKPPGSFIPISDLVGGGPFHLIAGEWTDDTSMALCLAESLIQKGGFDPVDQLERYLRWWHTGYLSSNGRFFDIGGTTSEALRRFERTSEPYPGLAARYSAGNGSLMRLAPVPMFYARQPSKALARCADASRTTHAAPQALDACRYFGMVTVGVLLGVPKESLLSPPAAWDFVDAQTLESLSRLDPEIRQVAAGSFKHKQPPEIQGSGYVVRSLEAALWAFYHSDSFQEGALLAANLGEDADTTAAIYGQLAGAYYGEEGIPLEWRSMLAMLELIIEYADKLFNLANGL